MEKSWFEDCCAGVLIVVFIAAAFWLANNMADIVAAIRIGAL